MTNFNREELQFVKDNCKTMKYKDIADILGKKEKQVRNRVSYEGWSKVDRIGDPTLDQLIHEKYLNGWSAQKIADEYNSMNNISSESHRHTV